MKFTRNLIYIAALALLATFVLVMLILARREPVQPVQLQFSTLAQQISFSEGLGYQGKEPGLLIIADPERIRNPGLDLVLPPDLAEKLRSLDYRRNFALFVFHGRRATGGYKITVQQVERRGSQVIVRAEFVEPGLLRSQVITSPYHLIAIEKEGRWGHRIHFILLRNEEPVAETTSYIP